MLFFSFAGLALEGWVDGRVKCGGGRGILAGWGRGEGPPF